MVMRESSTESVFSIIQRNGALSRTDIAETTGFAPSTVSVITGELQERGLIQETGFASSTGGRRPILLEVNQHGGYFLCASLEGARLSVGVIDLKLQVVEERTVVIAHARGEALYIQLEEILLGSYESCLRRGLLLLGLGVATPGMVDPETGRIVEADNLSWYELDLKKRLEAQFPLPIIIENDTNAAAIGELLHAKDDMIRNMLYVTIETGIGAGLILEGQLYAGSQGRAGEIGHVRAAAGGKRCLCGKRGCLETIASVRSILQEYEECSAQTGVVLDAKSLVAQEVAGDELAHEILRHAGQAVGVCVGNELCVLNVDSVVFGGEVVTGGTVMMEGIREGLRESVLPKLWDHLSIRTSTLGEYACYAGLSQLILKAMFQVAAVN